MDRIKFRKNSQRSFLNKVIEKTNVLSLRALLSFGISTNYSSLKNYYNESRLLPKNLFEELLIISSLNKKDFSFEVLNGNWGQIRGGKKSKRK